VLWWNYHWLSVCNHNYIYTYLVAKASHENDLFFFLYKSGAIGFLLKYISPISVVPLIALVGLALFDTAANSAAKNWGLGVL
jgi:hypothetical protein